MSTARAGIILQARMGSQRLPGKVLEPIGGRSMLEHCLHRLTRSGAAPVILATTNRSEDDVLAALARRAGAGIFRGDATDVLLRYARCADQFGLDLIVRATADSPAVDIDAPGRILATMRRTGAEYVCEQGLPIGGAVEGITRDALAAACLLARDPDDREQVTTFVSRHPDVFRVLTLQAPPHLARPDVCMTVDTADDLRGLRDLYFAARTDTPSLEELIAAWDRTARRSVA